MVESSHGMIASICKESFGTSIANDFVSGEFMHMYVQAYKTTGKYAVMLCSFVT